MSGDWQAAAAIVAMAIVTVVTRCFFVMPRNAWRVPSGLQRALQFAPLAALVAVLAPEVFVTQGAFLDTWRSARLLSAVAATLWYVWRPGLLGPLVAGLAVYLPIRLVLGW
jgi:branched-subunit amino acid transport protein